MPYQWTAERERRMLLCAISSANLRPSADTWQQVATLLGEGLTPSAVSQKYYKLRHEMAKVFEEQGVPNSTPAPTTPTKRKAEYDNEKKSPPSKRPRKTKQKSSDPMYGVPFRDESESPQKVKYEDMAVSGLDAFHGYNGQFHPAGIYPAVNMADMMSGQGGGNSSGGSSSNSFMG
ncbi:hypothetical protein AYL99_08512 [Fonsecaea erecta]|uniref:Myb-like domain-containing protein n=1 Tax=Fonsecaea erecta TaxID=1367422 RepID=A0A178ZD95_9EURO|nr:hypothetical protein AYL99_08512 [Fonsecaea erecta]OAP57774.1 hypothetical protein AYL99_08512 [Fonsecaea erecta]